MMKKTYLNLLLALTVVVGVFGLSVKAEAAEEDPSINWAVTYDGSEKLTSTLTEEVATETITSAMPGDTIQISVDYKNSTSKVTDWYLSSKVLESLETGKESSSAAGGGYTYAITYNNGTGIQTIYDSKSLGGDNTVVKGLLQANATTDKESDATYLYIGQLTGNASGTVYITIKLDGTSQDNSYMDTLAQLGVQFGVEETEVLTEVIRKTIVTELPSGVKVIKTTSGDLITIPDTNVPLAGNAPKTGDSIALLIVSAIALLLGIMLLVWYFYQTKNSRGEEA